jgi:hypothetical protein
MPQTTRRRLQKAGESACSVTHKVVTERRNQPRQIALLRVGLLHIGDAKELCVVRNISDGGLSVRVYRAVALGQRVRVELKSGELLEGFVLWARNRDVGICLRETVDVQSILAGRWVMEAGKRQRSPRLEVTCRARLRLGSRFYTGVLCDISQGGAKIRLQTGPCGVGEAVLTLPDLPPVQGMVRWVNESVIGVSFNERMPFEILAHWLDGRRSDITALATTPSVGTEGDSGHA